MKSYRLLLVGLVLLAPFSLEPLVAQGGGSPEGDSAAPVAAQPKGKMSLAVLPFSYQDLLLKGKFRWIREPGFAELTVAITKKIIERETSLVLDKLITGLVKTNKFDIIERRKLDKVLDEHKLTQEKLTDPARAVELGKLIGADYLLLGSISLHTLDEQFKPIPTTSKLRRVLAAQMIVDVKVVNASTSKILAAERIHSKKENSEIQDDRTPRPIPPEFLDEAHRGFVDQVVAKILDWLYPLKVVSFKDGVVFLNRGEGSGIQTGEIYDLYVQGQELLDPDTGSVLGREEKKIGAIRITEVLPKFSKATPASGDLRHVPKEAVARKAPAAEEPERPRPRLPGDE